ncbi:hypothetical protein FOZ60_012463 [Perkinsus olseni]|uniref:Uncharacterized protein n=1 Tax=Perkinsus olseni TaxID=32597 RepID=A0A7J6NBF2_PEROL|nr:hypothetical protein FOZ60_012463 [Perkinsus olseni]
MPITSLLLAELPGSVEALDLAHVQADITRRQVAALAVWRAEQYLRAWKTYVVEYDRVLQLGNKTPSSDPTTREESEEYADGSVPSVVAASSSSSNGLQGTVAGNESYWF